MTTLPLSDIVDVSVVISPIAAARAGFNIGLIMGSSAVIDTSERVRVYAGIAAMVDDGFAVDSDEYLAAELYFSAVPKPSTVVIGFWDDAAETALAAFMDARAKNTDWYVGVVCGISDYDTLELAAYAEAAAPSTCFWFGTNSADELTNNTLVAGREIGNASPSEDIHTATTPTFKIAVDGDTVTPTYQSVTLVPTGLTTGALIAAAMQTAVRAIGGKYASVSVTFSNSKYVITSGTVGKTSKVRCAVGATNDVAAALKIGVANGATDTDGTGSVGDMLKSKGYMRTMWQYATDLNAICAILGYAMGANNGLSNSAYTLAYKREIGVTPTVLSETQITILKAKYGNAYINRGNTYNLFEQGTMVNGSHFDEVLGIDMLVNDIQLSVLDLLVGASKVPQTEAGVALLISAIDGPCKSALQRGFLAPGTWLASPVLNLAYGDMLSQGYMILSESIASQSEADRSARIAPPIYVPIKEAGAIEHVVIGVYVNR